MTGRYRRAALVVFAAALALSLILCILIYNGAIFRDISPDLVRYTRASYAGMPPDEIRWRVLPMLNQHFAPLRYGGAGGTCPGCLMQVISARPELLMM